MAWAVLYVRSGPDESRRRDECVGEAVARGLSIQETTDDPARARDLYDSGCELIAPPEQLSDVLPGVIVARRRHELRRRLGMVLVPVTAAWEWVRHHPPAVVAGGAAVAAGAMAGVALLLPPVEPLREPDRPPVADPLPASPGPDPSSRVPSSPVPTQLSRSPEAAAVVSPPGPSPAAGVAPTGPAGPLPTVLPEPTELSPTLPGPPSLPPPPTLPTPPDVPAASTDPVACLDLDVRGRELVDLCVPP